MSAANFQRTALLALRPFANLADAWSGEDDDFTIISVHNPDGSSLHVTVGDLRRALDVVNILSLSIGQNGTERG